MVFHHQGKPCMGVYTSIISCVNHHSYSYLLLYNYPAWNYFLLVYSIRIAFENIWIHILQRMDKHKQFLNFIHFLPVAKYVNPELFSKWLSCRSLRCPLTTLLGFEDEVALLQNSIDKLRKISTKHLSPIMALQWK